MRHILPSIFLVILVLTGCGGPMKYTVTGTVTFDGEPIADGHIAFIPEDAGQGGGGRITKGRYTVQADPGKNRVEVRAVKKMMIIGPDGKPVEDFGAYIPPKYNINTTLKADITEATTLDFPLTSK
jgi:hypothetical protein